MAGTGSIGRRHLRNLQRLGCRSLFAYRATAAARRLGAGVRIERSLPAALAQRPWAVLVCNPSALHVPVALQAARAGCHLFVEKPVSHSLEGVAELQAEVARRGLIAQVGFHFRFHPGLREVARWLDSGLVGEVAEVSAFTGRRSGLDLDVEDTAHVLLRLASGALATVTLDYVQRPAAHTLRIVGRLATIEWDAVSGRAWLLGSTDSRMRAWAPPRGFRRNQIFLAEMRHFLRCLAGEARPSCTLEDGVRALEISLAAKRSAEEGRVVRV